MGASMNQYFATTSDAVTEQERAHERLVRRVGAECVVLLENDGALPFKAAGPLALFGDGARHTVKGGTGSGDVNTRTTVTVERGLEAAGFTIASKSWLDRNEANRVEAKRVYVEEFVPRIAKEQGVPEFLVSFSDPFTAPDPIAITDEDLAEAACDRAIYVLSRNSGEGSDRSAIRGDYLLSEVERGHLELLAKTYKQFVVVLNVGGVMDLAELSSIEGVNGIVLMGQLGSTGGAAIADVLSGAVNPSGKLTDTWARDYDDYPSSATFSSNDGDVDDEYYAEGIFVGYRYFDSFGVEPLYPFGFGRSYTTFTVAADGATLGGRTARVKALVTNTGDRAGKEVVQLYASAPRGSLAKAEQVLVASIKTPEIAPGDTATVELTFDIGAMASFCTNHSSWCLQSGDYILRLGADSRHTEPAAVLVMESSTRIRALKSLFKDEDPVHDITPPDREPFERPAGVPVLTIDPAAIELETVVYSDGREPFAKPDTEVQLTADDVRAGRCSVEDLVAQLTLEELAELCVGTARSDDGSIVGNASLDLPGAAGDTSPIIKASRHVRNLIMADGPAGLRLQPIFKTDKEGNLLPGGEMLGDSYTPFDPSITDENSITYYQYCTAIPIGWSLAQSWDMTMLEEVGSIVGEEMETFGVDIWLAPALNIHRNPLCGRNFEYYSEDPLVSGRCAAAINRGVQSHEGRFTCIKHFATNNQENNRYFTNSHVSEQALREIYLRGFEIAIRESQPGTIMTSYNLLNGIHTANSHDLLQAVARDEWGFQGFIMTDWYTSQDVASFTGTSDKYPISASTGCVYAGNDVQMPGCQKNVDDIVKAVESGQPLDGFRITLADVQHCAANVIRIALKATAR
nr:beta-glucosidase [uncultured bacterium]